MIEIEQIYKAIEQYIDLSTIKPNSDFNSDLGIDGDDFDEMINLYQQSFSVDMSEYLWYFHMAEEGSMNSIGSLFFKPPYNRVNRIAVTPLMLQQFANKGKWDLDYPEHKIPKTRWDIVVTYILLFITLSLILYYCLK